MDRAPDPGHDVAAPSPRPVTRLSAVAVAGVLVALVLATTVAFAAFTTHSGASSPEDAVRDLLGALEDGDAVGTVQALAPSEQRVLIEPLTGLVEAMDDAGVLADAEGLPGVVPGVTVAVDDLVLRSEVLDEQVTFVHAEGGSIAVAVDPAVLPDEASRADAATRADDELDDGTLVWTVDLAEATVTFGTVDEGGGWHVSLAYTAAEQLRQASDAPLPDTETRPDAIGSTTPSEVVTDLFGAVEARFPQRVAELVSPYDGRALYDYATVWLPGMQAAADAQGAAEAAGLPAWTLTVADLVVSVDGDADVRRVDIDRLDAVLDDVPAGERWRITVGEDGCTTWLLEERSLPVAPPAAPDLDVEAATLVAGDVRRSCPGQPWVDGDGAPVEPPGFALTDLVTLDGLIGEHPGVTVVERGGRWFLSPTRTVLDSLVASLERTPPEQVGAWTADLLALALRGVDGPSTIRPF